MLAVLFLRNAAGILISVSEAYARSYTTIAVADDVSVTLKDTPDYSSLMTVTRDKDGNVTDIIADAALINSIARSTAYLTQKRLNELSAQGVQIPVGAFTGIDALAGFGFKITVKIIPVSAVECCFVSRFTSAGINQTLHSLYIQIASEVSIVTPSKTVSVGATNEVLVCESVIVGEIPDIFLGNGYINSYGILVPQSGS
ncbi:MAG: sporulation protein YunB [Clostridia bacterium]|nr:sporulation protein YunB [Clostridia bacterium]